MSARFSSNQRNTGGHRPPLQWRIPRIVTLCSKTAMVLLTLAGVADAQQPAAAQHRALVNQYCVTCHNERLKTGELMLDKLDLEHVGAQAETWEKVVRKVRAGLMPPAGAPRPQREALAAFAEAVEH